MRFSAKRFFAFQGLARFSRLSLLIGCLFLAGNVRGQPVSSPAPKLKIDYWLNNYKQVTAGETYELAQKVFKKITRVADNPASEVYSLYIFSDLRLTQVFALPDGAIIVPLKAIDFCLQDREAGEARLAFIFGHEIKHLIRDDYWIYNYLTRFFVNEGKAGTNPDAARLLESMKWELEKESRKAFETRADEAGILYTSLAGYDVDAVFAFIPEYYHAAGIDLNGEVTNNSVEDRRQALTQRLGEARRHLHLFDLGVMLYAIGENDAAIECFEKFLTQYPSREVFNNLGLCYYSKALALFARWSPEAAETNPNFVFKLSAQIDPASRLRAISQRGIEKDEERQLTEAINRCLDNFERAKNSDPGYEVSHNNLGCAYLLKGEVEFAIGNLKQALKLNPSYSEAHNNLGVCYAAEGDGKAARNNFEKASQTSLTYADPIFNLGQLNRLADRKEEAAEYFRRYLQLDKLSAYAEKAKRYLNMPGSPLKLPLRHETMPTPSGSNTSSLEAESLASFSTRNAKIQVRLDKSQHVRYFDYQATQGQQRISIIAAGSKHQGQTQNKIRLGDPEQLVAQRYPYPLRYVPSARGAFWVFVEAGLGFEIQAGKVNGWFLFDLL